MALHNSSLAAKRLDRFLESKRSGAGWCPTGGAGRRGAAGPLEAGRLLGPNTPPPIQLGHEDGEGPKWEQNNCSRCCLNINSSPPAPLGPTLVSTHSLHSTYSAPSCRSCSVRRRPTCSCSAGHSHGERHGPGTSNQLQERARLAAWASEQIGALISWVRLWASFCIHPYTAFLMTSTAEYRVHHSRPWLRKIVRRKKFVESCVTNQFVGKTGKLYTIEHKSVLNSTHLLKVLSKYCKSPWA